MHDGEALQKMVENSKVPIKRFADLMEVHRNTVTRWYDVVNHPDSRLIEAAKVLKENPADYFPRFQKLAPHTLHNAPSAVVQEGTTEYTPLTLRECEIQLLKWQAIAYKNLEDYNTLLKEHNQLLRQASATQH